MALTTARTKGVRKLANGQAPTIRADIAGIVDDIGNAAFAAGASLPASAADKWPGRSFFHTGEGTWYVCDGTDWLPVGGERLIALGDFGAPAAGYEYDAAGGASYVRRSGKRMDVRLRIRRTTGNLSHGQTVFQVATAYRPAGVGSWPVAANQSGGGTASASVVAAVLNADGAIFPLSPGAYTTIELNGTYYIP